MIASDVSLSTTEATFTSTSKAFHSSILSQRETFTQLSVQLSSICYNDFQSLIFTNDTSEISRLTSDLKSTKSAKSITEIILENDVTIHQSSKNAVKTFTVLIFEYFDL